MTTPKTPGVYVEEISTLAPAVAEVETAIPAFIGYTEKGEKNKAKKIGSLMDYQLQFGSAESENSISAEIGADGEVSIGVDEAKRSKFVMYYAMRLFFANGGGQCYIIPVGNFGEGKSASLNLYSDALTVLEKEDEPTLIVFPDAPYTLNAQNYYALINQALAQCEKLKDRFTIIDVLNQNNDIDASAKAFRDTAFVDTQKKYGAAYFPNLKTTIAYSYNMDKVAVKGQPAPEPAPAKTTGDGGEGGTAAKKPEKVKDVLNDELRNKIKQKIADTGMELTPCAAIAGLYARVDTTRGVWKAPANEALQYVTAPAIRITDKDQDNLNVDVQDGKSINAIRSFIGKGTKVWGARTLMGNDNEWRYISVRRFFNMVEESVKKSTGWAVFEPNDVNTWNKVRAMIENYLILKWKEGALAGVKPDNAFYVRIGLGQTMTPDDVLQGKMNVEIGLAAVRPAEFIILQFSHKLQTS